MPRTSTLKAGSGAAGDSGDGGDSGDAVPRGLRWRLTASFTKRSRAKRLASFVAVMRPHPSESILDVGVTDSAWRASNFLESGYPWPSRITAVGLEDMPTFRRLFPDVQFRVADGRHLPFDDGAFDIGFSNAVIEHVGTRAEQQQIVAELLRTCRRVFVATPNARFPVDPHTLLPFVHWLPRRVRAVVLRWTGNARWASIESLNPLGARDFMGMFPRGAAPRLHRQRLLGLTTVLVVEASAPTNVATREGLAEGRCDGARGQSPR
jgi:hypothetical protein